MSKTQRWEWAIGLDLSTLNEQHLHKAYKLTWDNLCKFDNCRKNCKRILCLACFDKTWIDNDGTNNSYDNFETTNCEQKRADLKTFVGLKNLGATCYVNCLLQLWFHNPALRKAIYEWDKNADSYNENKQPKIESGDVMAITETSSNHDDDKSYKVIPNKRPRLATTELTQKNAINSSNDADTKATDNNNLQVSTIQESHAVQEVTKSTPSTSVQAVKNHVGQRAPDAVQNDPIQQLQLIFARLQFTNKKSIDPFNFIESLALNAAEQQDAQEFGNLFIEFLEKSFANQKNKFVSNIIKNQFLGKYSYATICDHCKHSSVSDSNFYELDLSIQNLDTLHDCLNEYFRPVPLDGKYNCSHCQKAQSAHRKIILKSVPPTLNLQLLRFVYDKQRNTRQKINSFIIFPEILDMTPYLNDQSNRSNNIRIKLNPFDVPGSHFSSGNGTPRNRSNIYILTAVLIHRGSSPHSGHYIAHIKDRITKDWYKFNDDCVERIGPQLQVSTDGESISIVEERTEYVKFNDPASGKVIKMESKSLKSKTAYMLVYQAHDNEALTYPSDHSEKWALPDHLQCSVAEENSKSDEMFESLQIAREVDQQVMEARRDQIRKIYDKLVCREPTDKFEFIDKNWLQNWLTNSSTSAKFPPIDNSNLLCVHDKLDFRKLDQVKCVRTEGADLLYKEFGGGPRLQDAMCRKCVELEVELIQLKERMKEDQKFITSQAKFKLDNYDWVDAYIVGRNSYRDWQALVMAQFEKSHPELANRKREHGTNNSSDEDENKASKQADRPIANNSNDVDVQSVGSDEDDAIEKFVFNSDIQCEHGQLIGDTAAWRIVPREVWLIFKRYFGNNPEHPLIELNANTIMCPECRQQEVVQQEIGDIQKAVAQEQKSKLPDLFHLRKRASWCSMIPGDQYYILDKQFLTKWQKFLRNPCNQEKPVAIVHDEKLTCKHKLSLYNSSNSNPLLPECPFVLISSQELAALMQFYPIDHTIRFYVDPKMAEEKLKAHKNNLKTSPTKKASLSSQDNQNNIKQTNNSGDPTATSSHQPPANTEASSNGNQTDQVVPPSVPQKSDETTKGYEVDLSDIDWSDCIVSDPGYCSECHELLKQNELKRLLNYDSATIYITKFENRTARRNRNREQAYTIKPNQTLLELKKEIFTRCQVLPVDQRLFLDDILLDDNSKTMAELMIVPNCSLRLEIDRPMSETIDLIEDESASRKSCAQPETGFKGSLLLSNNHF
jgi:ubiquitin carboxyl-terminal hydrolase 48